MVVDLLTDLLIVIGAVAIMILIARLVFRVPVAADRTDTTALPPPAHGALADALDPQIAQHAGLTGVAPLYSGAEAFAARILLADAAVSSIDVQYYIWRGDMTGHLLLDAMRRAADRGVRVRLLLDDNGISGLDPTLAALNSHPCIEIRLYNPFNLRRFKRLSYGFDFFRLNRRMHNKSFTVDGHASILGGRNVGDEYFGTGAIPLQIDLDVLAVGAIVSQISTDFDRYWAARSTHPAGPILGLPAAGDPVATALHRYHGNAQLHDYRNLLDTSDLVTALARGDLALEWTTAILVSDDPVKGEGAVAREDLLATVLLEAVGQIKTRFDGITPYFVPGAAGVRAFDALERGGVTVRMLTNSLEATNMLPVHAGYTKRRNALLRAGVGLFEVRKLAGGTPADRQVMGPLGSSGSALHAKTFAVDGARVFVGSFNFDPRSATLNTEMGLLIESRSMADAIHAAFDQGFNGLAWQVQLRGRTPVWTDPADGTAIRHEPGSTPLKRLALVVIGKLPVEWLL